MKKKPEMDYSFMHFGGVYQALIETTQEACRRFGADEAMNVIHTYVYSTVPRNTYGSIVEIKEETGVTVTASDLVFLANLATCDEMLRSITKALYEGVNHGKD